MGELINQGRKQYFLHLNWPCALQVIPDIKPNRYLNVNNKTTFRGLVCFVLSVQFALRFVIEMFLT